MDTADHGTRVDGRGEPPAACDLCDVAPEEDTAVLTWTLDTEGDDWRWICPPCSRDHVRSIESRLSPEWW